MIILTHRLAYRNLKVQLISTGTSAIRFESSVGSTLCEPRWCKLCSRISCRGSTCHCRTSGTRSIWCRRTSRSRRCWYQNHFLPNTFPQRGGSSRERNRKRNTCITWEPRVGKSSQICSWHLSKIERCERSRGLYWRSRNIGMASSNTHRVALLCSFLIIVFVMLNTGFDFVLLRHGRSTSRCCTRTSRSTIMEISNSLSWTCPQRMVLHTCDLRRWRRSSGNHVARVAREHVRDEIDIARQQ